MSEKIFLEDEEKMMLLDISDIRYMRENDMKTHIYEGEGETVIHKELLEIVSSDREHFVRCRNDIAVNIQWCKHLESDKLELYSGEVLPVASEYNNYIRERFRDYVYTDIACNSRVILK